MIDYVFSGRGAYILANYCENNKDGIISVPSTEFNIDSEASQCGVIIKDEKGVTFFPVFSKIEFSDDATFITVNEKAFDYLPGIVRRAKVEVLEHKDT